MAQKKDSAFLHAGSSGHLAAVTPHDTNDLAFTTRYVFVGGAGNLRVIDEAGNTVTLTGVTAGSLLPIRVTRILSTSTTATNIAALF